jgi:hypothetical protein
MAGPGRFAHFISCTLPVDAAIAARIVSKLLRKGYDLPEDVELNFRYREKNNA